MIPPLRRLTFGRRPKSKQKVLPLASGPTALDLIRFAHPAGQPSAVTALRSVSSLHHCSRGPPRRAIHGPSRLSRHPCRSTPCATIPLLASLALRASLRLLLRFATFRPPDGAFVLARADWFGGAVSRLLICRMGGAERYPCGWVMVWLMGIAALHPSYELLLLRFCLSQPSTHRPNNAVPESRQEAEWRCCGEGRLAWMPNEERWARDGPP